MTNPIIPAALAAASIAVLAACGNSAPAQSASSPAVPAAEQAAVTTMTAHCTENAPQLEEMLDATHGLEVKAGITDETVPQLAAHLATVVSAYKAPVSCVQAFAAYVTMREG